MADNRYATLSDKKKSQGKQATIISVRVASTNRTLGTLN